MKKISKKLMIIMAVLLALTVLVGCSPKAPAAEQSAPAAAAEESSGGSDAAPAAQKLVFGYVAPSADTWYQRSIDGFTWGAEQDGHEVWAFYSDYDVEKELAASDSLVQENVAGICYLPMNESGPVACAKKAAEKNIPVVVTDGCGAAMGQGVDIAVSVDFDWYGMGVTYAHWMADNYPGENFYIMTGTLESVPCQRVNAGMLEEAAKLGKNENVGLQPYAYQANDAVNVAQDLLVSGLDFSLLFVMDETAGVAVIRMLDEKGALNNPIKVFCQNGNPIGLPLMKNGDMSFTISSSPGWAGLICYYAMRDFIEGNAAANKQIMLPVMPITMDNIDDPMKVVPWDLTPDVFLALTKEYFPEYVR